MTQTSPEITIGLLVLTGLLAGLILAAIYFRRVLAATREQLTSSQNLAAQRGESLTALRVDFDESKNRAIELDAEKGHIERQQARLEAEAHSLRERLEEKRGYLADKERALQDTTARLVSVDKEMAELATTYAQKQLNFEEQKKAFEQARQQLKIEFQNLANQILEEKGKTFAHSSQTSLDAMLKPFREQIDGFQKRVNQVHDEAVRGNVSLATEIKRVLDIGLKMSVEANTLATALKGDKKASGNWGEVQLEKTLQLAGLVKGDHYESQARFKDEHGNNRQPDFIVKLPDRKHMVIDSKVSLVDYDRAIAADSDLESQAALDAHAYAVRNHIDDLSKKDYSNLIGMRSPSFVLMFMPIEPAYIEAMKHNKDLFNYGYQRNVIMVSHTTLMPILKTVANLWMVARSNEQAHELSARAGDIYNQIALVAERLKKLGDTMELASRRYNETVTSVAGQQGLYGKASRFNELSSKANKVLPAIEPLLADYHTERLELITADSSSEADEMAGEDATDPKA